MSAKRERSEDMQDTEYAEKRLHYFVNAVAIHQAQISISIATAMYHNVLTNHDVTTAQLQNAGVAVEAAWAYHNNLIKSIQSRGPSPHLGKRQFFEYVLRVGIMNIYNFISEFLSLQNKSVSINHGQPKLQKQAP